MTFKERKVVCSITEKEGENGISGPILFGMLMSKLKCRGLAPLASDSRTASPVRGHTLSFLLLSYA